MGAHRPCGRLPQGGRGAHLSDHGTRRAAPRVCRVLPDVPAIDRAFDYLLPDDLASRVEVGTVVRVPLHGRRVRGWVIGLDVVPETALERLVPVRAVVSAGPPGELVDLCAWAAWRWSGPQAVFLRAATPPNVVAPGPAPDADAAVYPPVDAPVVLPDRPSRVVRWPPTTDRVALVRALVDPEGSTIVIAPDAAEDAELIAALEGDGRHVLVWRSDQDAARRTEAWLAARHGACVVLGGRVAAFAPVPDLRAVVVLDDGDEALKEERAPTWHARELSAERVRRTGARFDIVGPTPTVEATELAGPAVLPERATERAGWPRVDVVDLRDEPPGMGLLSDGLGAALSRAIEDGGRAVCVLNRKGRARLLACRQCNELARCERCDAAVAETTEGFSCPRCGEERPLVCLHCGATTFRAVRPGVVRVREQIAGLVPSAHVVAVEGASAPVPAFDVAVGTEAVLHRVDRGGRRPVRLVAFLDFDQELLAPRYRATEQALWLLVRAARLVGDRAGGGVVLVQTRVPADPAVLAASDGDPSSAAAVERARRAELHFPPFGGLAEVSGVTAAVDAVCERVPDAVDVLGPDGDRALLRAATAIALADGLAAADLTSARALGRVRVDVDPLRV